SPVAARTPSPPVPCSCSPSTSTPDLRPAAGRLISERPNRNHPGRAGVYPPVPSPTWRDKHMSTRSTGQAVMRVLRQTVDNLDAQRDQLRDAIERDHPSRIPGIYPGTDRTNPDHERAHRDLRDVFADIAAARGALVDAHNGLRD